MAGLSSASGFLALLDDNQVDLQVHALQQLNTFTEQFWPEIADSLEKIEKLYEDANFPAKQLAALVASKVFYHLGSFPDAMQFALAADGLFDLSEDSQYVQTLTAKCVDAYSQQAREAVEKQRIAKQRERDSAQAESSEGTPVPRPDDEDDISLQRGVINPKLENIVERMFEHCFADQEFKQALGIAVESMRLDIVERSITASNDVKAMLQYCYEVSTGLLLSRDWRRSLLRLLVRLYQQHEVLDYVNMSRCLVFLNKSTAIAKMFDDLLKKENQDDTLLVFQIGFELVDNAPQHFLTAVRAALPPAAPEGAADAPAVEGLYVKNLRTLHKILEGEPTINFNLEFMYRNNHADLALLNKLKGLFEPRLSVLHTGTIVANAIMHCGTTRDTFLRENLEWLSKAINWAKFTTTAGLGVIHRGHIKEAFTVLDPYLPKPGVNASPYTEGGSLYALGLIFANHGHGKTSDYLLQQLRNIETSVVDQDAGRAGAGLLDGPQKKEIVQHGAALGLGVAAMASENKEVFAELMNLMYHHDSAVAGEAAGLAMGLVMLGSATDMAKEMLSFAHATQHEKVIRSLGLGLAMIMYGLEEKADAMIETLNTDKDPILRYGGQFTIGLAYCGTANNKAIRQLLHIAVSDVSDDVRRAAVISLGFVLFRQPEQVPRLVSLLAESYNPNVRYGAAIALGIACAGTGMKEAIALLEPMTRDSVPFVRQGAFIALAMVLIQVSEKAEPKVKEIRQQFLETISDKHQSIVAKLGAIIAMGIIDAGGRNVTIALTSRAGHINLSAIVGLLVFTQYWYWYPFFLFISLAFTPTAIIAVNANLEMPKYRLKSNAKPSLFAYPEEIKEEKEKEKKALPTAQLSITKKVQLRQEKKKQQKGADGSAPMDVDATTSPDAVAPMDVEEKPAKPEEKKEPKAEEKPEQEFDILSNPARVTRAQLSCITFDVDPRYVPITEGVHGVILLKDTKPGESEEIIKGGVPAGTQTADDEANEPEPPEAFEFLG